MHSYHNVAELRQFRDRSTAKNDCFQPDRPPQLAKDERMIHGRKTSRVVKWIIPEVADAGKIALSLRATSVRHA
jgi:hypothetical protein